MVVVTQTERRCPSGTVLLPMDNMLVVAVAIWDTSVALVTQSLIVATLKLVSCNRTPAFGPRRITMCLRQPTWSRVHEVVDVDVVVHPEEDEVQHHGEAHNFEPRSTWGAKAEA